MPQVLVLELETRLQKERERLGELRKKHYALAGVAEGWGGEDEGKTPKNTTNMNNTIPSAKTAYSSKNIPEFPIKWGGWRFLGWSDKLIGGAKGVVCLLVHNSLFLLCFSSGTG